MPFCDVWLLHHHGNLNGSILRNIVFFKSKYIVTWQSVEYFMQSIPLQPINYSVMFAIPWCHRKKETKFPIDITKVYRTKFCLCLTSIDEMLTIWNLFWKCRWQILNQHVFYVLYNVYSTPYQTYFLVDKH